jgi:tetratricopeptide (TPR) repeat protein
MRIFVILLILTVPLCLHAQDACHSEPMPVGWVPGELLQRPIELRNGIGRVHDEVTTSSAEAQQFYDQGLAYLHSYVWVEAARSFHQALRLDQKLAMAYVGLSRASSGLWDTTAAAKFAEKAKELIEGVSPRERARIEVRLAQIEAIRDLKNVDKLAAYRRKLDQALTSHFEDLELWNLRGNVEDRLGAAGIGQYGTPSSIPFYEHILSVSPGHFGADHFLVHSYELAGRIDDALRHGAKYAAAAPEVPHAHHMYGHDLRRVGRTREAIERFQIADRLERAYFEREKIRPEIDWHHPHNLDLLATSFQHQGEMRKAEEVMRRSYALPPVTEFRAINKKEWPSFLIARNRLDDAAAAVGEMSRLPYPGARAAAHVYAGHLALLRDDAPAARRELDLATSEAATIEGPLADFARSSLQPYFDKLRGAILLRGGDPAAREMLMNVQSRLRAIPGPDAWMQALFELESIARLARQAGDWDLVEYTAGQMLEHDAAYAGGHYMMSLAAQARGRTPEAAQHLSEAKKHWTHADRDLREAFESTPSSARAVPHDRSSARKSDPLSTATP